MTYLLYDYSCHLGLKIKDVAFSFNTVEMINEASRFVEDVSSKTCQVHAVGRTVLLGPEGELADSCDLAKSP